MPTFIVTDFDTHLTVGTKLGNVGNQVNHMKPVMENIFQDMRGVTLQNFYSGGRRGGGSWKRLTTLTIIKKGMADNFFTSGARPGYTSIGGDALVKSVTGGRGSRFQIRVVTNDEVQLGSKRPYARDHQFGKAREKTGDLPARPFLQFKQDDADRWNAWIAARLMEGLKKT